ncbi:MAG: ATP-binding protein [Bacteroidota bacterium]
MNVVGRDFEVARLKDLLNSPKSELVAVFGRRRIGKTFLVREVFKEDIILDITGLYQGTMPEQLKNFHNQLKLRSKRLLKEDVPKDWLDAFELLKIYIEGLKSKNKKVIFIDEFPWIATLRSKFLMCFENFWNSYCTQRTDLIVVICGSAASYMVKNIINNKGGLHNRISCKIRLEPFNLYESELFLKSKNINLEHYDLLQLYMAVGGIPFYLDKIKKGESVVQNINRLCFEKGGDLVNEFNEVFASLFSDSKRHIDLIKTLAENAKGITRTELLEKNKMKHNGFSSSVLNELIESGFVSQYTPFGKKDRNSLFRLSDEYCMFYLKFINPFKNQGKGTWEKLSSKQTYKVWSGFAFEIVCLKHIQQIKNALGVGRVFSINSSWFNQNAQIDLVIDRDDNRINLCEMKFHSTQFVIDSAYFENLRNKMFEFKNETKTRKGVYFTTITTFGLKQNAQSLSIIENDLTMDCLFGKREN